MIWQGKLLLFIYLFFFGPGCKRVNY